jgi:kynureninase
MRPQDLHESPNALAPHYSRFRVSERALLTGHSHQAWPDRGFAGQIEAWNDAAELVDGKWERAFAKADRVRAGFARLLGDEDADDDGDYALAASTHELVTRFLSALPLPERPRLVTTDGEFHSIRRQLDRLDEEGRLEIVREPAADPETLAERLAAAVDGRTAAVLASAVLFRNARVVPGLGTVAEAVRRHGALLLVDVYHALGAVPYSLAAEGLEDAFVVGGGYKYLQLGEGNCFLRTPPGCDLRPIYTGWYAEFEGLERAPDGRVTYGGGPWRFAGSTYDPTSHYRAAEVFDFFAETGLEPPFLREVSRHQVRLLAEAFDALDLDPSVVRRDASVDLARVGGFLVLESRRAGELCGELRRRGVMTDHRGDCLRLGPAPYLSDRQLRDAVGVLGEAVRRS